MQRLWNRLQFRSRFLADEAEVAKFIKDFGPTNFIHRRISEMDQNIVDSTDTAYVMRRIREDYLRILRLFRFHAWYGKGEPDAAALAACAALKEGMVRLSVERISKELLKLLAAPRPASIQRPYSSSQPPAERVTIVGDETRNWDFELGTVAFQIGGGVSVGGAMPFSGGA